MCNNSITLKLGVCMQQSKLESLIESMLNSVIGYLTAIGFQMMIFPIFDIKVDASTNFKLAAAFTVLSIARTYVIRRWCNRWLRDTIKVITTALSRKGYVE